MTTDGPQSLGAALDGARMTPLHRKFWLLAALGIMLDGFDFFIIGVANPLIANQYDLSDATKGLVSAAAIIGAIFGAMLLGPVADRIGRRRIFKYDLAMFAAFSVACIFAWNVWALIAFRFALGLAIGLDYPVAASYLAEVLPTKERGRWLVGAFSLQAAGILLGAVVGVIVLVLLPHVSSWRIMLGFGVVPALVIIWLRRSVPESPRWLALNGYDDEAVAVTEKLVGHQVVVTDADRRTGPKVPEGLKALFQPELFKGKLLRRTIFTSVPWCLMDIATYGVGIFTPTLLAAIALAGHPDATFLSDDIAATKGTAALDVCLVLGFLAAIFLVERWGRIPLQLTGFAMMAVALSILGLADALPGGGDAHLWMVIVGFVLFNFFMNAGPNATTYALPAEVFPCEVKAAGQGFAAGLAKLGAALGVFLFPILEDDIGTSALLFCIAGVCLVAFLITYALRIEPKGRSLDEVSGRTPAPVRLQPEPHPVPP
jgi:MFS family permease